MQQAEAKIPQHVAVIMDGNGRWARQKGRPRIFGHRQGTNSTRECIRHCSDIGVKFLSLYVFSSENWARPPREVSFLMALLAQMIDGEIDEMMERNVRLRVLGDLDALPKRARRKLTEGMAKLDKNTGLQLQLCVSYGGRQEIARATRLIAEKVQRGDFEPEAIDEEMIGRHMYEPNAPDPELMIRTGGEFRISNFLLWQFAYSELYVTDILWPDFTPRDLDEAISFLSTRQRRFGKVLDQDE